MKNYFLIFLLILSSCKKDEILTINSDTKEKVSEQTFNGYKVDVDARKLGKDYWENTGVLSDLIAIKFSKSPRGFDKIGSGSPTTCGDFNLDGYIDVFVSGGSYGNVVDISTSFLIWNPINKNFENKNLFNNNLNIEKSNIPKTIPFYFNDDDYVDLMVFCSNDEGVSYWKPYKMVLILSDGNGKYNQHEITTETPTLSHAGGDVGDLNQDDIPDLVVTCGGLMKILWGTKTQPYFDESNSITFANPIVNLPPNGLPIYFQNNNGFDESCIECISEFVHNCKIADVNNDNINDLILCSNEDNISSNSVLINLGYGKFNKNSIIKLPRYNLDKTIVYSNIDYVTDDVNYDGKMDIIAVNTKSYKGWDIFVYIQKEKNVFEINKSIMSFTLNSNKNGNWKSKLIHYDYNNDGRKDITYIDDALEPYENKGVLIKSGNNFIEKSILDYDSYLKSLKN